MDRRKGKRGRNGKNVPLPRKRGVCAEGGNSGINLLARRFQSDTAFRNAVMKGCYRYSNGVLLPSSNNIDDVIVVGPSMPKGVVPGVDVPGVVVPGGKRTTPHYGRIPDSRYRTRLYRFEPKTYPKGNRGRLREWRDQRRIILDPGSSSSGFVVASSSGSVEGLLDLISNKSFGATLTAAMEYLGVTVENLAFESHIDDRKIVRLRNDYSQSVYREDVLAIVIGLHLPPPIGEVFFQNAKIYLGYHDHQDVVYHMILGTMSQSSVDEVNAELRNAGLKEIPRGARRRACGIYLE